MRLEVPRPVVHRSLPRLEALGLVEAGCVEPGQGPNRPPYAVTERLGGSGLCSGPNLTTRWVG